MNKETRFVSLMQDKVFKSLWQNPNPLIQDYFSNLLKYITDIDISHYNFSMNELPIDNNRDTQSKVDVLLESQDKQTKINVELNPINKSTTQNKNNSYVYKIAGAMFDRNRVNKYEGNIRVIQINFNGFYFKKDHSCPITRYKLHDIKINDTINDIEIINIYLPVYKNLCYNNDTEIYKDFAMFDVKNYSEMAVLAENNERRLKVMEEVKEKSKDETIPTYNYELYMKDLEDEIKRDLRKEILEKQYKEGVREGKNKGIKKGYKDVINQLISNGMPKEELSKYLSTPII